MKDNIHSKLNRTWLQNTKTWLATNTSTGKHTITTGSTTRLKSERLTACNHYDKNLTISGSRPNCRFVTHNGQNWGEGEKRSNSMVTLSWNTPRINWNISQQNKPWDRRWSKSWSAQYTPARHNVTEYSTTRCEHRLPSKIANNVVCDSER